MAAAKCISRFVLRGLRYPQKPTLYSRFERPVPFSSHPGTPPYTLHFFYEVMKQPPTYEPCLFLPKEYGLLPDIKDTFTYTFYSLKDKKITQKQKRYMWISKDPSLMGSSHGWLAFFDSKDDCIYLNNPSLPVPFTKISNFQNDLGIKKIALSLESPQKIDSKYVLAFLDEEHNLLFRGNTSPCSDVVYFTPQQKFYAWMEKEDTLEALDHSKGFYNPCIVMKTAFSPKKSTRFSVIDRSYLVESYGDLLLVKRYLAPHVAENGMVLQSDEDPSNILPTKTVAFDVHKMNFEQKSWELVKSLGDRALFVGRNESFSLCTRDYPYLSKNSVYFADGDVGVFNIGDDSIERLHLCDDESQLTPPSIWMMADTGVGHTEDCKTSITKIAAR